MQNFLKWLNMQNILQHFLQGYSILAQSSRYFHISSLEPKFFFFHKKIYIVELKWHNDQKKCLRVYKYYYLFLNKIPSIISTLHKNLHF